MEAEEVDRDAPQWQEANTLFGGFLHQDFDLEHGDEWGAVRAYVAESTRDELVMSATSLRRLLTISDDESLERVVGRFGLSYHPPGDGYSSYRYWLTAVAEHLEDPEARPGPPERDAPLPRQEGAEGRVSTFTDDEVAERAVAENLEGNRAAIERWRRTAGPNRAFEWDHGGPVGRLAPPDAVPGTVHEVDRSRVVLRRTKQAAEGWYVLVAYPVAPPDPAVAVRIDRSAPEWDDLWTLCGGYLHQDFAIHDGVDGAIGAFEAEALDGQRAAAALAVRRLLDGGDDGDLAAATEWLGLDYHPPGDGQSLRAWLTALAARLEG